jgi:linoleoyl-CoA desaturase
MILKKLTFPPDEASSFIAELRERAASHFNGASEKGGWAVGFRAFVMLGMTFGAYALILTNRFSLLAMLGLAVVMGVGMAGIGFGVAHDALHGSYSRYPLVNKIFGLSLDICGGSSYIWKVGHNLIHHTYTNIVGVDADLDTSAALRQSPHSAYSPQHRYQHLYAIGLYSLATLNWSFLKDYKDLVQNNWGAFKEKTHRRQDIVAVLALKCIHYVWTIVVPLLVLKIHWWQFLIGYVTMHITASLILGHVFQLAHVVEGISYPLPNANGAMAEDWVAHELRTTANFSNGNALLTWYVGGLNHQIEHHLFPRVASVHYYALSKIVRSFASEHGLPYIHNRTFFGAVRSHYRLMKTLGAPVSTQARAAAAAAA